MEVLFKPTKASEVPIRHDYDQAVSYFVGAAAAGCATLASASRDTTVKVWNARTGAEIQVMRGHTSMARWRRTRVRRSLDVSLARRAGTTSHARAVVAGLVRCRAFRRPHRLRVVRRDRVRLGERLREARFPCDAAQSEGFRRDVVWLGRSRR